MTFMSNSDAYNGAGVSYFALGGSISQDIAQRASYETIALQKVDAPDNSTIRLYFYSNITGGLPYSATATYNYWAW